jgi:glycosyltransferase involved in cell wall biosynthesis
MESILSAEILTIRVIMPIFNSGRKAINGIRSILAQTNVVVQEIVVVDDGSTDGSADFIRNAFLDVDTPVNIISILNGGAANARNYGMENCCCDLYAFLDSDDTWLSDKLEQQIPFFTDPSVGMVGCLTTMGGLHSLSSSRSRAFTFISLRQQLFKNYFQTSTVVVRRSVVESVGPFPSNQRHAEEGDFFNRIVAKYQCVLLKEVLVDYGSGKHGFGASGLSANLVAMEKGELQNILRTYHRGECGFVLISIAVSYSLVKFIRRFTVTFIRRLRSPF